MFGGIAILRNLLCVAHGEAHGQVFLVDLDERRVISRIVVHDQEHQFTDAEAVAVDGSCSVYVADTRNDVVRRYTAFGRQVARYGTRVERGPGTVERDRVGVLDRPRALAVHRNVLWVASGERKLVRGVQAFDLQTGEAIGFLRAFGEVDRRFGAPRGLFVDATGVLVADTLHGVIQRFVHDGRYVGEIPLRRDADIASRPIAVLRLPGGDVLVVDAGDRGGLARVSLSGVRQPLPDLPEGTFVEPSALATDAAGRVYVLDRHGERVQRLSPDLTYEGVVVDLQEVLGRMEE
ncbi:MAG: hypothetical protein R3F56_06490 [Planctomycetota bacterium]